MHVCIGYGSQGGRAAEVSGFVRGKIEAECPFASPVVVHELNKIEVRSLLHVSVVVLVCSTTGNGDTPYNMQMFWTEAKKKAWTGRFPHLHFSVIGLGDSSYAAYNYVGKRVHNRMVQLGGRALAPRCDCNNQDPEGVYTALKSWWLQFRPRLLQVSGSPGLRNGPVSLRPGFSYFPAEVISVRKEAPSILHEDMSVLGAAYSEILDVTFRFDIGHLQACKPGDVLVVRPENTDYAAFLREFLYGIQDMPQEKREELEHMCRSKIDYTRIPLQHVVAEIGKRAVEAEGVIYTGPLAQRDVYLSRLQEIGGSYDRYEQYVIRQKKSYRDLLQDFRLKVGSALSIFPDIFGRYYTVSRKEKDTCAISAGLIRKRKKDGALKKGLCSEYLRGLQPGTKLALGLRPSGLLLGGSLLVVSTGTGISLARALFHAYLDGNLPDTTGMKLVLGFRSFFCDFLYASEFLPGMQPKLHVGRNGSAYIQFTVCRSGREVEVIAAPSRIREDIALARSGVLQSKHSELQGILSREMKHLLQIHQLIRKEAPADPNRVLEKNYVDKLLAQMPVSDLQRSVILSGSTRLAKTLPRIIEDTTGTKPQVQAECW